MIKFFNKKNVKNELIKELKLACEIASQYSGGYSGEFLDATEFYSALKSAVSDFENGDDSKIKDLWIWFAPTTAWDDFIGSDASNLANSIFNKITKYIEEQKIKF
jgi:hypothetical protein